MNTNQQYHEENRKKAIQNYYNTSLEAKIRDNNLLKNQVPRLLGKQRGIKLFGESKSCDYDGNITGGSNITYSAALNSDEYEKYRKQLLQRRVDSLQAMKEEGAPPPMVELSQNEGDKLQSQSLLDSILNQISDDGTASFDDIYKYIKFLVNNIYFFDTNDFINLINIFDNLDDIMTARLQQKAIMKSKPDFSIIDIADLLRNIKNYIKQNMKGENLDINKRKMLAKSTISYLKLSNTEKALSRNVRGRDLLKKVKKADDDAKAAAFTAAAAAQQSNLGALIGRPLPQPPPPTPLDFSKYMVNIP